jgi:hypothetical protein
LQKNYCEKKMTTNACGIACPFHETDEPKRMHHDSMTYENAFFER